MIERTKKGLLRVFAEHGTVLHGFFVRRGANHEAEDLVQETYVRLLRAHDRQAGAIANPEAYLFTISIRRRRS